jgi:hypothetical protein
MNQATAATITMRTTTPAMILFVVIAVVIRGTVRATSTFVCTDRAYAVDRSPRRWPGSEDPGEHAREPQIIHMARIRKPY